MYMQFFLPMQPPTTTHNAKQLHAYMKGGQPHAVLHDSPELKQTRAKLHAHLAPHKDEMTRLHFWADDAQVCSEIVEKFWSDPCGVFVRVEEL